MAAAVEPRSSPNTQQAQGQARALWLAGALTVAALGTVYYLARRPVVTLTDASVYLSSALSLVSGHGYRLLGYVSEPVNTFYPPGYAWALAPLLALQPDVPALLPVLQLTSVLAYLALCGLGALVLRRCLGASARDTLLATLLAASTPLAAELSTRLLSDTLYGVVTLGAVLLLTRGERARGWHAGALLVAGALLTAGSFYVRTAGVALVGALALDTLRRTRSLPPWRVALGLLPLPLLLPWVAFTATHGGALYWRDYTQGQSGLGVAVNSPEMLLVVVLGNLLLGEDILWVVAPALVNPAVFPPAPWLWPLAWPIAAALLGWVAWQSARRWWRGEGLLHLYVLLTLALVLTLPYRVEGRFLWPLAPVLAWYLLDALRRIQAHLARWHNGRQLPLAGLALALLLAANGWFVAGLVGRALTGPPLDGEYAALLDMAAYLRALEPHDAPLGTNHNAAALWWHLYTGRQGVDALARADGEEPAYTRASAQASADSVRYFVYHRANGTPGRGADDWAVLRDRLAARGADTQPLYCTAGGVLCVFDWQPRLAP